MKNDSPLFPLDHLGDSLYDMNGDGELTGFETMLRDSDILNEMEDDEEEAHAEQSWRVEDDGDNDDFEDEEDDELNALLSTFSQSLNKRKDVIEKLRGKLDSIADKLDEIAGELEYEAEDLDDDSDRRTDMESFADALNEALDPLRDAIRTLEDLDYLYF